MRDGEMLEVLARAERALAGPRNLLDDPDGWDTLDVNYVPPRVERLWRDFEDGRVYLHRIHPCEKAFYHSHPWPSAIKILSGGYEMGLGYAPPARGPAKPVTIRLPEGASYEMIHPAGWHYVRPIGAVNYSIMVSGPVWPLPRRVPKPPAESRKFGPLNADEKASILETFRSFYGRV